MGLWGRRKGGVHIASIEYRVSSESLSNAALSPVCCLYMQENVTLIREINELRRELKQARTRINDLDAALGLHRKVPASAQAALHELKELLAASTQPTSCNRTRLENLLEERERIIDMQRIEIHKLRDQIYSLPPNAVPPGARLGTPPALPPIGGVQPEAPLLDAQADH